jgi:Tetratricopeptide repeat
VLGAEHPDTLGSMDSVAETFRDLGDLQGARELHEQTLAARRRVLSPDHPDTLRTMNSLTRIQRRLEELPAEVEEL